MYIKESKVKLEPRKGYEIKKDAFGREFYIKKEKNRKQ
jgi:hypothetical protein